MYALTEGGHHIADFLSHARVGEIVHDFVAKTDCIPDALFLDRLCETDAKRLALSP